MKQKTAPIKFMINLSLMSICKIKSTTKPVRTNSANSIKASIPQPSSLVNVCHLTAAYTKKNNSLRTTKLFSIEIEYLIFWDVICRPY